MALTLRIGADTREGKAAVEDLRRTLNSIGQTGEQSSQRVASGFGVARQGIQSISTQLQEARSLLMTFWAAAQAGSAARGVIQVADEYAMLGARLKVAAQGNVDFAAAQRDVFEIAQDSRGVLGEVSNLYGTMARSARTLNVSQREVADLTEVISKSMRVSGGASAASAAGIQQLNQALQSGVLRGDEFNSIMENSPRLAGALADGLGVPIGKLRQMAEAGELTAQKVTRALLSQADAIRAEYAQLPVTVEGSLQKLENAFKKHLGEGAGGHTQTLALALDGIADHFDEMTGKVEAFGQKLEAVAPYLLTLVGLVTLSGGGAALASAGGRQLLARMAPTLLKTGIVAGVGYGLVSGTESLADRQRQDRADAARLAMLKGSAIALAPSERRELQVLEKVVAARETLRDLAKDETAEGARKRKEAGELLLTYERMAQVREKTSLEARVAENQAEIDRARDRLNRADYADFGEKSRLGETINAAALRNEPLRARLAELSGAPSGFDMARVLEEGLLRGGLRTPATTLSPVMASVLGFRSSELPATAPPLAMLNQRPEFKAKTQEQIKTYVEQFDASYGFNGFLTALVKAESSFNPKALSNQGAVGLGQLMPDTARRYGLDPAEREDPRKNLQATIAYLNDLLKLFQGDLAKVAAAYNLGEGGPNTGKGLWAVVEKYGERWIDHVPAETRTHVNRVMGGMEGRNRAALDLERISQTLNRRDDTRAETQTQRDLQTTLDGLAREEQATERSYQLRELSAETYFQTIQRLRQSSLDAEIRALEQHRTLTEQQTQRAIEQADTQAEREAAQEEGKKRLVDLENKLLELSRKRQEIADQTVVATRQEAEARARIKQEFERIVAEAGGRYGSDPAAIRAQARRDLEERYAEPLKTLRQNDDQTGLAAFEKAVQVSGDSAVAEHLQAGIQRRQQQFQAAQQRIQVQRETGALTPFQAQSALADETGQAAEDLQTLTERLEALGESSGLPAIAEQAKLAGAELEALKATGFEWVKIVEGAAVSSLADNLIAVAHGAKSAGEAFRDFGLDVARAIENIAAQRMAEEIIGWVVKGVGALAGLVGGTDFSALSPTDASLGGGVAGETFAGAGLATGGPIVGPGTGTSDDIPAWLSNGEYVLRARAVRAIGVDTLNRINKIDSPEQFMGWVRGVMSVSHGVPGMTRAELLGTERAAMAAEARNGSHAPDAPRFAGGGPVTGGGPMTGSNPARRDDHPPPASPHFAEGGPVTGSSPVTGSGPGIAVNNPARRAGQPSRAVGADGRSTAISIPITIHIENQGGGERGDITPEQARRLGEGLRSLVQEEMHRQMRPGGVLFRQGA